MIPGFVVQFGLHADPEIGGNWRNANIKDDAVTQSNKPGFITFATAGPNTRTTQLFINLATMRSSTAWASRPLARLPPASTW